MHTKLYTLLLMCLEEEVLEVIMSTVMGDKWLTWGEDFPGEG